MSRTRVLVVDDDSTNCEVLHEMLDDECEVISSFSGHEAVALAERHRPDVILLDVMLPGANGYNVCRRLRQLPGLSAVRIVMVSAGALPSERKRGMEAGADAYVTKPFDYADLLLAMEPG